MKKAAEAANRIMEWGMGQSHPKSKRNQRRKGNKAERGHVGSWTAVVHLKRPGSGNPTAVVLCPGDMDDEEGNAESEPDVDWMRRVAKEFHMSRMAFVWERKADRGGGGGGGERGEESDKNVTDLHYNIRFYANTGSESELSCGHATLASASVLLQRAAAATANTTATTTTTSGIVLHSRNDILRCCANIAATTNSRVNSFSDRRNSRGVSNSSLCSTTSLDSDTTTRPTPPPTMRIAINLPWKSVRPVDAPADRRAVLSMLKAVFQLGQREEEEKEILYLGIDRDDQDLLVEVTPEAFAKVGHSDGIDINISALGVWGGGYHRGVILCCRVRKKPAAEQQRRGSGSSLRDVSSSDGSGSGSSGDENRNIDFLSRFFVPKAGINEDPVTGSIHCTLGPYFGAKIGRSHVVGKQMSVRGGIVECMLSDGGGEGEGRARRVDIVGTAMTVVGGTLYV